METKDLLPLSDQSIVLTQLPWGDFFTNNQSHDPRFASLATQFQATVKAIQASRTYQVYKDGYFPVVGSMEKHATNLAKFLSHQETFCHLYSNEPIALGGEKSIREMVKEHRCTVKHAKAFCGWLMTLVKMQADICPCHEVVLGYQVPDTPKALEDSMLTSISATFEAAYANNPKRVLGSSPDDFEPHKSPKSDVAV